MGYPHFRDKEPEALRGDVSMVKPGPLTPEHSVGQVVAAGGPQVSCWKGLANTALENLHCGTLYSQKHLLRAFAVSGGCAGQGGRLTVGDAEAERLPG